MVNKWSLLLLILLSYMNAEASPTMDAQKLRDEALQTLKSFSPGSLLKDFTTNPNEASLQPKEGTNILGSLGLDALKNEHTANEVYQQAATRPKIHSNPKSPELRYAESLLENPERVLSGECFKAPGECREHTTTKTCEETMEYQEVSCKVELSVHVKRLTQNIKRLLKPLSSQKELSFDLQNCSKQDVLCTEAKTITIAPSCEQIEVAIEQANQSIPVIKQPRCSDTTVTIPVVGKNLVPIAVAITQFVSEEELQTNACNAASNPACFLDSSQTCLEPNQVKIIDGVAIKRPCWWKSQNYQCQSLQASTCNDFINKGCSQTNSTCRQQVANRCLHYSQSFQCLEELCSAEKIICPGKMACTEGQCDSTQEEKSNDLGEGVSRLGALTGAADEVSANQVSSGSPMIFTGLEQECEKYPLDFRDCCTDSGWGDWVTHCPQELQDLQKAKHEHRVVYLGHYKNHKLGTRHYSYCIFPNQLAAIVQIQGRGGQLGISYGTAKSPNCRGLSPEELARINFELLNLSAIEQSFVARMLLPNDSSTHQSNQSHVEQLHQEGSAHD